MASPAKVFIVHHISGELYSVFEASKIIGIPKATLYKRIHAGDTGAKLWRPNEIVSTFTRKIRTREECEKVLQAIPAPTKFDNLYGGL